MGPSWNGGGSGGRMREGGGDPRFFWKEVRRGEDRASFRGGASSGTSHSSPTTANWPSTRPGENERCGFPRASGPIAAGDVGRTRPPGRAPGTRREIMATQSPFILDRGIAGRPVRFDAAKLSGQAEGPAIA